MVLRSVGKHIDKTGDLTIQRGPSFKARALDSCGKRDGRNMQKQVGRSSACRMHGDRVVKRILT